MLICTEGVVSEPALIQALKSTTVGQAPVSISSNVEILPLPLGGNHGHAKLVEVANKVVAEYSKDGVITLAGDDDTIEKWIIVDHDDMEKHGVSPSELREEAKKAGFTLVISKPNFEFFVLATLSDLETAKATNKDQFESKINSRIEALNEINKKKGFGKEMLLPKYSKKKYPSEKLFGLLLNHHPELVEKMTSLKIETTAEKYSEMSRVIKRIIKLYGG